MNTIRTHIHIAATRVTTALDESPALTDILAGLRYAWRNEHLPSTRAIAAARDTDTPLPSRHQLDTRWGTGVHENGRPVGGCANYFATLRAIVEADSVEEVRDVIVAAYDIHWSVEYAAA